MKKLLFIFAFLFSTVVFSQVSEQQIDAFKGTATGTDTYAATLSPAITAYVSTQVFNIKFTNGNTGAATININAIGAKSIVKNGSAALISGDIIAGQIYTLAYDGTNFQIVGNSGVPNYTKTTNLNITGKGVGGTKTTTTIIDNSIVEQYSIGDEVFFDAAPGYDYMSGDLTIDVDFCPMGAEVGKEVQWQLIYLTHDAGEVINGTTGTLSSGDIALSSTQYLSQVTSFTIPAANVKEEIHFRVKRIAIDTGSEPATEPAIVHVHISYNAKIE